MKLFSLLHDSFLTLVKRFPLASLLSIALTGLLIYSVRQNFEPVMITKGVFAIVVAFFLSISTEYIAESIGGKNRWPLRIIPLLYGVIFFWYVQPTTYEIFFDSQVFFGLNLVGFCSAIFIAPFLVRKSERVLYANYVTSIAWTIVMSGIVGIALVILGSIAINAVGSLFDLNQFINEHRLFEHWMVISLALIAPHYALIHLPQVREINARYFDVNRFFAFLLKFVAIPFIIIYFCILYAYSVKVLMNFDTWPKGIVSWMVIGFSSFGYLIYIFSRSYEDGNVFIRIFRRCLPYAVAPQIVMLAYAIYLRINQYDLTVNRYLVVIFGIWLTLISLYYIFNKTKSLIVIPATLTVLAFVASVGPWSVYQWPLVRQYDSLVRNLQTAHMIQDGVIIKKPAELPDVLENTISSQIQYICNFSNCRLGKTLFAKTLEGKIKPEMKSWEIVNIIHTELDITFGRFMPEEGLLSYALDGEKAYSPEALFPLDVRGYDTVIPVYSEGVIRDQAGKKYVIVNSEKEELTLVGFGENITLNLKEFNLKLAQKYPGKTQHTVKPEDLIFKGEIR